MNRRAIAVGVIILFFSLSAISTASAIRPTYVYDRANILDAQAEATINSYCEAVDRNSTAEIVVVTLTDLKDYGGGSSTDTARHKIFNDETLSGVKGIGQAGKNNGVLLVLVVAGSDGKPHSGIEVGYGLEGNLTDGRCGRILDNYVMPALKVGNYSGAGIDGVTAIAETAIGTSVIATSEPQVDMAVIIIIVIVAIVFIAIFIGLGGSGGGSGGWSSGSSGSHGGGGGFGGGGSGGGGAGRFKSHRLKDVAKEINFKPDPNCDMQALREFLDRALSYRIDLLDKQISFHQKVLNDLKESY
jgi:uncharacterized protein